jgi:hypothetical protein
VVEELLHLIADRTQTEGIQETTRADKASENTPARAASYTSQ